ncbi:MAG: hypothetical protein IPN34_11290 [Planctomycetes bacterium]|nr:hypothetical protein [Planctomycetota bacterium]MBL8899584.1 hypothetical protein [Planctomycetota bacterium]
MDERGALVASLKRLSARARELLARVSPGALEAPADEDGWKVHDLIVHLADAVMVQSMRLRRMIAEDHPVLQAVDQDKWLRGLSSPHRSAELARVLVDAMLASDVELVELAQPKVFDRRAYHPVRGDITFPGVVEALVERSEQILGDIERAAQRRR